MKKVSQFVRTAEEVFEVKVLIEMIHPINSSGSETYLSKEQPKRCMKCR